jgi:hypothetical protein
MIRDQRFISFEKRPPVEEEEIVDFEELFLKKPRKKSGAKLFIAS